MSWGTGPLNVWNLLLVLFFVACAVWGLWGLLSEVRNWRARAREAFEEVEALERGDRETARREITHGVIALLAALAGLVVVILGPILGRRRIPSEAWHAGWLAVLFFGSGALFRLRRGVRAYRKSKPQGRA